jgi:hypothetical protein
VLRIQNNFEHIARSRWDDGFVTLHIAHPSIDGKRCFGVTEDGNTWPQSRITFAQSGDAQAEGAGKQDG